MTGAREVVPGAVYALGGNVPLDGRVSWAPALPGVSQPASCYLLKEAGEALLVDTGLPAHWPLIEQQLRELVEPGTSMRVFLSRPELDCAANLPPIRAIYRLEDTDVLSGGSDTPFDFFNEAVALQQPARQSSHVVLRTSGFDLGPERPIRIVVPRLRFLPTYWPYDVATKTLFTSDLFSHLCTTDAAGSEVGGATADDVASHLLCKFWWLDGCITAPFIEDLTSIFDELEPEVVAPGHGSVIRGRENIRAHVVAMNEVLERCARAEGVIA